MRNVFFIPTAGAVVWVDRAYGSRSDTTAATGGGGGGGGGL